MGPLDMIILVGVVGLLIVVAYFLDKRRSKEKGVLLYRERPFVWKGNRLTFYFSLLILLIGAGIFTQGVLDQSTVMMIIGALVGGGAFVYRFYVQQRK